MDSGDQPASNSQNSDANLAFELAMLDNEREYARKRLEIMRGSMEKDQMILGVTRGTYSSPLQWHTP